MPPRCPVVAVLITIAVVPRITLWGLTELKMEMLLQVWPMFLLGLHWRRLTAHAALAGLVGIVVALGLPMTSCARPFGLHDGDDRLGGESARVPGNVEGHRRAERPGIIISGTRCSRGLNDNLRLSPRGAFLLDAAAPAL